MALVKTEAVVLKSQKQGETSKILTLYTRHFGKIKLIAKGSRSLKSRYWGNLEPLNYIAVVFYQKENRELQFLSQADIIRSYPGIRSSLGRTTLALAAGELIARSEWGEAANPLLFRLLLDTLEALDSTSTGARNVFRSFQIKFLEQAGFKPKLDRCLRCGSNRLAEASFILEKGGYICGPCAAGHDYGVLLSPKALGLLRRVQNTGILEAGRIPLSAAVGKEMDLFLQAYLRFHLEGLPGLKSLEFLEKVSQGLKEAMVTPEAEVVEKNGRA